MTSSPTEKNNEKDHTSPLLYSIENIRVAFPTGNTHTVAFENVSFPIRQSEFVVVVGPSGSGKSTLLKSLAHLITPTEGKIVFHGHALQNSDQQMFGFVFQQPTLLPWRNTLENIVLPLEIMNTPKAVQIDKAKRLMKTLHLERYESLYPSQLSGGIGQRTAIARALITNPVVMLMDEPFSALDELMRQKLNAELLDIKKETRATIIFVTHSISEAVFLGDKVVVMGLHPNTVKGIIPIHKKERSIAWTFEPEYVAYVKKVREMINPSD